MTNCSVGSVKTTLYTAKNRLLGYMESRCRLIKKSNPCRCEQWVKFGISQGWITEKAITNPLPKITIPEKVKLYPRDLRDIYKNVYLADKDELLAKFIKEVLPKKNGLLFLKFFVTFCSFISLTDKHKIKEADFMSTRGARQKS